MIIKNSYHRVFRIKKIYLGYDSDFQCIHVSFDKAANNNVFVDSPIKLMELIDKKISNNIFLIKSPFQKKLQEYKKALYELETKPLEGEKQVTPEQIEQVKKLTRDGLKGVVYIS